MQNLKNRVIFALTLLLVACQSAPVYEIKTIPSPLKSKLDDQQVIVVKTNRIHQECLFYNAEAENNWRHQYFMYILNDKNEVLPIMHAINQEDSICKEQLGKIQKILNRNNYVRVCANSILEKVKSAKSDDMIDFGPLGKHAVTHEPLFFDGVCNPKKCFIYKETLECPLKAP
jgi:hypothetical protein